ncbi:MAG: hypothetical protein KDK05_01635, partial [Candidatus Competibacteraceae bacterium]|nr:hypothetical protein [Candidatus Competibacteraceae bacterium]
GNRTGEDTFDPQNTLQRSLNRVYDSLGRLQDLIGNNGQHTRLTYDDNGNLVTRTDGYNTALARTTTQNYDALDRLIQVVDPYNGAAKPTVYDYNSLDQLTQVTDPEGLSTRYGLNVLGDQHTLTSPDTGITNVLFDAAGNRIQQTDARGVTVAYDYDALGRITLIDYTDNSLDVSYSYDDTSAGNVGIGRLTSMTDASGTTRYFYDRRGQLTQQTRTVLSVTYQTDYAYDAAGNLTRITYPSGRDVDYTRDAAGRISAVSTTYHGVTDTLASNIHYDPFGPMTDFSYGNGLSRSVSFDLDGRIDTLQSGSAQNLNFGYNALDQLTSLTDLIDPNRDQALDYDTLDRLASGSGDYGVLTYSYDGVGNRQSQSGSSGTDSYSYDPQSHRLLSVSGPNASSRSYDNTGNTTQLDALSFTYGENNRLIEVQQGASMLASYAHNGQGQRIIKTANGQTTVFHYDQAGQLMAESDASGTVQREYVYLNGQFLALMSAGQTTLTAIVDNEAATGITVQGAWETSSQVSGFIGTNYLYAAPDSTGVIIDNSDAAFSVSGAWPSSTAVSGYHGEHYQYHDPAEQTDAVIVDNSAGSAMGSWPTSTAVSGYYQSHYQLHNAGDGSAVFTWPQTVTTPAEYHLYARWTAHANRASNATYTITHSQGQDTVTVDQQHNGGQWYLLGRYTLDANSQVSLTDQANGVVIADAIKRVPLTAPPAQATWALNQNGEYQLYARWTANPNRTDHADYTITHSQGQDTVTVNQQQNGGQWHLLGTYRLDATSQVSLSGQAEGYVIADALRLVATQSPSNTVTWALPATGSQDIYARWTAHPNRTQHARYTITHSQGQDTVTVDQQHNGGQWYLLGRYTLDANSQVSLPGQTDGYTVADAL